MPNQHLRKFDREEINRLLAEKVEPKDVAEHVGCSVALVYRFQAGLVTSDGHSYGHYTTSELVVALAYQRKRLHDARERVIEIKDVLARRKEQP